MIRILYNEMEAKKSSNNRKYMGEDGREGKHSRQGLVVVVDEPKTHLKGKVCFWVVLTRYHARVTRGAGVHSGKQVSREEQSRREKVDQVIILRKYRTVF